jgi:hypothetical protein
LREQAPCSSRRASCSRGSGSPAPAPYAASPPRLPRMEAICA